MTIKLADAIVYLGTDDKELESGLGKAEVRTSKWGAALSGVMAGIGVAVAQAAVGVASAAVGKIGEVIGAASDMGETIAKTEQLFDESADAIISWAGTASGAFGQSKQQALDGAATYAIFGRAAGLAGDDLVDFSTGLVELASDLASFNNTSPEQAVQAIGAALRGESEPLRAYGVLLNDASLKAAAFDMGLTDSANATLTNQQKVLAAQKVIFEQTTAQQGNFARESQGLAAQTAILTATWDDFKAKLGTVFLPIVEKVMQTVNRLAQTVLPPLQQVIEQKIVPAVEKFAEKLGAFLATYGTKIAEWVKKVIDWFSKLIGGAQDVDKKGGNAFMDFMKSVIGVAVSIISAVGSILKALGDLVGWFLFNDAGELRGWARLVLDAFGWIIDQIKLTIQFIERLAKAMSAVLKGDWGGALYALTGPNVNTNGMVPLYDSSGNRIGWQSEEQARLKAGISQSMSTSNNVTVNITTTDDPNQVARDLNRAVQDALRAGGH